MRQFFQKKILRPFTPTIISQVRQHAIKGDSFFIIIVNKNSQRNWIALNIIGFKKVFRRTTLTGSWNHIVCCTRGYCLDPVRSLQCDRKAAIGTHCQCVLSAGYKIHTHTHTHTHTTSPILTQDANSRATPPTTFLRIRFQEFKIQWVSFRK
jgi:hypothetical protein